MSKQITFHPGVLDEREGRLIQMGNKCNRCGKTSFPVVELCPACSSGDLEKVSLGTEGTVFSYSITRVPVGPYKPPIIGAYIDLPEGTRIFGQIRTELEKVRIGMKVRMETGVIWTEKDGTEVLGYYYVPIEAGSGGGSQ